MHRPHLIRLAILFLTPTALLFFANSFKFLPPANALIDLTLVVFCFAAIALFGTVFWANASGRLQRQLQRIGIERCIFRWLMATMVIGLVAWALVVRIVPWAWTEAFGSMYSEQVLVRPAHRSLICPYGLMISPLPHGVPGRLCMREHDLMSFPNGAVSAVIQGKRSSLGSTVHGYSLGKPLPPARHPL
ncbi:hypothetical protein [Xanthomonas nasturtii]|uniref:Uncharacterized protein n=1 Tax=Xanthomonas nasturtii TaxID=1843581 RepID=A0ABT0LXK2_9XANT|nr:hypothetical protein [Xanthomonas nasturtii]MCL1527738.1 hypothetical protein [Xanthomonas nasturtii]MCL1535262.1 hypothetical protein [Xanthomonas nasturtii]MCL1544648.1 hypothetical protein [Xanthomonas nasturtii]MCL1553619.1 hypothetical protein [Xanthomonas nasturtii]MCL1557703.1 hypothetical protein [Xanthomonas nasturtii]